MVPESVTVAPPGSDVSVPPSELALQYALDTILYCHTFFPDLMLQPSPLFHRELFKDLDNSRNRFVGFECFRGSAKTTILRMFASKRIAYGTSRTIGFGSASQFYALTSTRWLRQQVEYNLPWANFYGIEPGDKWTDEFLEIYHRRLDIRIAVLAFGITGQVRGINIGGKRPDLLILDDPDDEESTGTEDQREKQEARIFGALLHSLTPASENPEAKAVLLQTSLHKNDTINRCHIDPTWTTRRYGILDGDNRSRWESRYPTVSVIADKAAHIARGQVLLWLREMECLIGDEETAFFRRQWLKFWEMLPEKMIIVLTCDPAPPPRESQMRTGLDKKDEEVWSVQGLYKGRYYLLEQVASRDHDPEWSCNQFFELNARWRPFKTVVETIAYQRTLKAFIEQKMRERRTYYLLEGYPPPGREKDRRKKAHRIRQAFAGIASNGALYVHPSQQGFITQFSAYPNVDHDDRLDAAAIGLEVLQELGGMDDFDGLFPEQLMDGESARLEARRLAP